MDSLIKKRENSEINNCSVSCLEINVKRNHTKKRTKSLPDMEIEPATKTVSLHMGKTTTANENKVKNIVKYVGIYTPADCSPVTVLISWRVLSLQSYRLVLRTSAIIPRSSVGISA